MRRSLLGALALILTLSVAARAEDTVLYETAHFRVLVAPAHQKQLAEVRGRGEAALQAYAKTLADALETSADVILRRWHFRVPKFFPVWTDPKAPRIPVWLMVYTNDDGTVSRTTRGGARLEYSPLEGYFNFPIYPPGHPDSAYESLERVRCTAAHEFFHFVHYGYDEGSKRTAKLREMSSVWVEDKVFPQDAWRDAPPDDGVVRPTGGIGYWMVPQWNGEQSYSWLPLDDPEAELGEGRARALLIQFLVDNFAPPGDTDGHVLVRSMWEVAGALDNPIDGMDRALEPVLGAGDPVFRSRLAEALARFYAMLAMRDRGELPPGYRLSEPYLTALRRRNPQKVRTMQVPPSLGQAPSLFRGQLRFLQPVHAEQSSRGLSGDVLRLEPQTGQRLRADIPADTTLYVMVGNGVGAPAGGAVRAKVCVRRGRTWTTQDMPLTAMSSGVVKVEGFGTRPAADGSVEPAEEVLVSVGRGHFGGTYPILYFYACLQPLRVEQVRASTSLGTWEGRLDAAGFRGTGQVVYTGKKGTADLRVRMDRAVKSLKARVDGKPLTMTPVGPPPTREFQGSITLSVLSGDRVKLEVEAEGATFPEQHIDTDPKTPVRVEGSKGTQLPDIAPKLEGYEGDGKGPTLGGPFAVVIPVRRKSEPQAPVGEHLRFQSQGTLSLSAPGVAARTINLTDSLLMTLKSHPRDLRAKLMLCEDGQTIMVGLPGVMFSLGAAGLYGVEENPRLLLISQSSRWAVFNVRMRRAGGEGQREYTGSLTLTECSERAVAGTFEGDYGIDVRDGEALIVGSARITGSFRVLGPHIEVVPYHAMKQVLAVSKDLAIKTESEVNQLQRAAQAYQRLAADARRVTAGPLPQEKRIQDLARQLRPEELEGLQQELEAAKASGDHDKAVAVARRIQQRQEVLRQLVDQLAQHRRDEEVRKIQAEMQKAAMSGDMRRMQQAQARLQKLMTAAHAAGASAVEEERRRVYAIMKAQALPSAVRP